MITQLQRGGLRTWMIINVYCFFCGDANLTYVPRVVVCAFDSESLHIEQEAQGLGALLDKMEDNDHIKLDNRDLDVSLTLKPAVFETQGF